MKKIISIFLFVLIVLFSTSCSQKELQILGVDSVEAGCSILMTHNFSEDDEAIWETSDESIAIVSDGNVIGIKPGEVEIYITIGEEKAVKQISVTPSKVTITIEGTNVIFTDSSVQFRAILSKEIDGKVIWTSSDENVAIVDEEGVVTALKEGTTTIKASVLGNESTFNVTVYDNNFALTISGNNCVIVNEEIQLIANFDICVDEKVEWSVSDSQLASISEDGVLKGLKEGKVTVYASLLGKVASFEVDVILDSNAIRIQGSNIVRLDQTIYLSCNYDVIWSSSDPDIADVFEDGEIFAGEIGVVTIYATDKNDPNNKASFILTVIGRTPRTISLSGKNKVGINQETSLKVVATPSDASSRVVFTSNNPYIATVDQNGVVKGLKEGKVIITATSMEDSDVISTFEIEVVLPAPESIKVSGENEMMQGSHNNLSVEVLGNNVTKEVVWTSSDPKIAIVYQGIVLGVNKGNVTITAHSVLDENVKDSIEIEVKQYVAEEHNEEDIKRVDEIISKMTLSQKIGQMFVVGFNGMEMTDDLKTSIEKYNFGNVIYMGYNVTDYTRISALSDSIHEKMIKENGVPAFITIDQEGGRVARLTNGGTHFISNMAMGATGNYENTYLEGAAMGKELRNYGINVDFAPVLDVNNNPENPIIGIRSYSDNPLLVSLYGKNMFLGLQSSNVMGCSKHFPGHGNTSVDSHYGLPTITTSMDELYQTELAPFVSAVANGIDSIMTTHIIFTAIDAEYPATLSKKVLTNLLREELGYTGLIITDGMEMDAVSKNFGGYGETAVMAVKAGADILTYTTTYNPATAHKALMAAVSSGDITEERINESVRRILLKKLKYGILDNYKAENADISELLEENAELNLKFAMESLTLAKGNFQGLDSTKKTLIISPTTSFSLGSGLESNSFSNYAANYLKEKGHNNCDWVTIKANISTTDMQNLLVKASGYDQIVVALSNVKTSKYTTSANFVNQLAKMEKELVVIALDTPYDLMSYSANVKNYICVYGYQKATVIALSKYLNGEYKATGTLAVSPENFN